MTPNRLISLLAAAGMAMAPIAAHSTSSSGIDRAAPTVEGSSRLSSSESAALIIGFVILIAAIGAGISGNDEPDSP